MTAGDRCQYCRDYCPRCRARHDLAATLARVTAARERIDRTRQELARIVAARMGAA